MRVCVCAVSVIVRVQLSHKNRAPMKVEAVRHNQTIDRALRSVTQSANINAVLSRIRLGNLHTCECVRVDTALASM